MQKFSGTVEMKISVPFSVKNQQAISREIIITDIRGRWKRNCEKPEVFHIEIRFLRLYNLK